MSPREPTVRRVTVGFPRVSGDEPLEEAFGEGYRMFSPRERG